MVRNLGLDFQPLVKTHQTSQLQRTQTEEQTMKNN